MFLLPLTTDDTSLAMERTGESAGLETRSAGWPGNETQATHTRTNGHFGIGAVNTGNKDIIVSSEKSRAVADSQLSKGYAPTAELDATDMACLCAGHDAAMARLMGRHASQLQKVVAKILRDRTEAADVVEETFVRVYQNRERFDLQAKFTSWLYTIALNQARSRLRSRARRPEMIPLEELTEEELESQQRVPIRGPAPDVCLEHEEAAQQLENLFAALPPQLREPLQLFACDELSQIEIANRLHCSIKAIESRVYHARKRLHADYERFLTRDAI